MKVENQETSDRFGDTRGRNEIDGGTPYAQRIDCRTHENPKIGYFLP